MIEECQESFLRSELIVAILILGVLECHVKDERAIKKKSSRGDARIAAKDVDYVSGGVWPEADS
jgi:hypothetical protein